jgi:hypothetical protein
MNKGKLCGDVSKGGTNQQDACEPIKTSQTRFRVESSWACISRAPYSYRSWLGPCISYYLAETVVRAPYSYRPGLGLEERVLDAENSTLVS